MVAKKFSTEVFILSENAIKVAYPQPNGTIAVIQPNPIAAIDFNGDNIPEVNLYRLSLIYDWVVIQDTVSGEYEVIVKDRTGATYGTSVSGTMLWP